MITEKRRQQRLAAKRRYNNSVKGRANNKRYAQWYRTTAKGIAAFRKADKKRWLNNPKRREDIRLFNIKHLQTTHGRAVCNDNQQKRRRKQYWDDHRHGHTLDALPLPDSRICT